MSPFANTHTRNNESGWGPAVKLRKTILYKSTIHPLVMQQLRSRPMMLFNKILHYWTSVVTVKRAWMVNNSFLFYGEKNRHYKVWENL